MAQLNVKLSEEQVEALRRYAARRRTPVAWLVRDHVAYLIAGGEPVHLAWQQEDPVHRELAEAAEQGSALDWLQDEPDLYTIEDGTPV